MMKCSFCLPKHCKAMPNAGRMELTSSYLESEIVKVQWDAPYPPKMTIGLVQGFVLCEQPET